jgi:monovalent cation:H+ antiporter, CPA1 family
MEMPLSETVLIVMGLLAVAMLTAGVCRNLPIPYTVVLVLLGILLGELCRNWPPLAHLHDFRLRPDIVFFVFLPALIFESGLSLDARQLIKDLVPILVLAVPALLISTLLIGLGLCLFLDIAPLLALLFGALISATDPVAVVALFKELGAPLRLTVLVEGESLMNDATAIVVFSILLGLAVEGQGLNWSSTGLAVVDFFRVFLGGALVGTTLGLFTSELLYRLQSGLTVIVTMSVVTAYVSFVLAEHVLQVSGVMATAAAAMAFGILGVTRLPREVTYAIEETWKVIALICNSLLFLLVGFSVHTTALVPGVGVVAVPVAVLLVLAARAATVYSLIPATTRLFSLQQVTLNERHIMWWGGLKGGLAIAIALSVPENFPGRQLLLDMALGVVLFTLLVNAPTIRPLVSKLGLDRFTDDERAELKQALRRARQRSAGILDRFLAAGLISTACHHRVGQQTEKTLGADTPEKVGDQSAHEVYRAALRTELEELDRLYEMGVITQYMYLDIRNTLQRDREAASGAGQRPRIGRRQRRNAFLRVEQALLRQRREHNWVAGVLFRYQNVRLSRHLQQDTVGILMSEAVLAMLRTREDLDGDQRRAIGAIYEERLARR